MDLRNRINQRTNVQQIFQQIVDNGPISRRELQEITGFSWGLISQVTNRLIAEGYIVAMDDMISAGVGRRAEKIDIVPDNHFFIGVDIDCDGMYAVVTDMKGRIVESEHYAWPQRIIDQVLQKLYDVLDALMEKYADKNITSIGVSTQGITDTARGISVYISKIKNWVDVPLEDLLSNRYGVDVVVAHDPDCLMECERCCGILKNADAGDVLLMHYNHRAHSIGMSVMINGQLYSGHRGRAAELGYVILEEDGDGRPRMLVDYLQDADVDIDKLCNETGKAMAVANTMYNPELIVLHIPECDFAQQMAKDVEHWIRTGSYDAAVKVKHSKMELNAKAHGAAMIMVDRAIDEVL